MNWLQRVASYLSTAALMSGPITAQASEVDKANALFFGVFPGITTLVAPAELQDIYGNGFSYGARAGWVPNAYLWPGVSVINIAHGGKRGFDSELRTLKAYATLGAGFSRADHSNDIFYFESGSFKELLKKSISFREAWDKYSKSQKKR